MYILHIFIWFHQFFFVHTFFNLHLPWNVSSSCPVAASLSLAQALWCPAHQVWATAVESWSNASSTLDWSVTLPSAHAVHGTVRGLLLSGICYLWELLAAWERLHIFVQPRLRVCTSQLLVTVLYFWVVCVWGTLLPYTFAWETNYSLVQQLTHAVRGNTIISLAGQFSRGAPPSCPSLAYDTSSPSKTVKMGRGMAMIACPVHLSPHLHSPSYMSSTFASASGSSTNTPRPASSSGDALTLGREPAELWWSLPTQPEPPAKKHSN